MAYQGDEMNKDLSQTEKLKASQELIWKMGFVIYLTLVMYPFFTGILQRQLPGSTFSYRPENISAIMEHIFSLIIAILPFLGLLLLIQKQQVTIVETIRRYWQQYPVQTIELTPFVWLFIAAAIRHMLALLLLLPFSENSLVQTSILILQLSVLAVFIICLIIGYYFSRKQRRQISK
jgi:hypothetical protein